MLSHPQRQKSYSSGELIDHFNLFGRSNRSLLLCPIFPKTVVEDQPLLYKQLQELVDQQLFHRIKTII
jgi:hypothetical protein